MWTDTVVSLDGRKLTLSVHLLEPDARDSVAATLAWLASTPAEPGTDVNEALWRVLVEDILGSHVRFTIDSDTSELMSMRWWDKAIRYAARTFVQANALDELIQRHLPFLETQEHSQANERVS